jgi:lysine-N-methylase
VLLIPDFMQRVEDLFSGDFRTDNVYHLAGDRGGSIPKPHPIFLALRRMLIDTVRDRSRPMWYRLLKIGHLCQDVDALVMAEGDSASLSSFKNFRQLSEDRLSHAELNEMPGNPRLRFEVVFALTEALVREGAKIRFQDTFWTFVEGISASVNSLPGDDVQRFLQAEQTYHLPFFDTLPSVLENYLINYMYQNLFPYGREGSGSFASQSIFVEYLQMTTQFAWVNALLIGVAGHYKESFAAEHVVQTIQSFTRTVEHYPHVLNSMNEYIRSLGLNNLRGMAIMLKH